MAMWCLHETINETTGVAPWTLVLGFLPRGPLAILKDSWCGEEDLPVNFGKNATTYLRELHEKLEIAKSYAASHAEREQSVMQRTIILVVVVSILMWANAYWY